MTRNVSSRPAARAAKAMPPAVSSRSGSTAYVRRTPLHVPSGKAARNASGRYPMDSTTSSIPWPARWATTRSIIGTSATGSIGFGVE